MPAGTRHSSNASGLVSEAHQPTFEYSGPTSSPAVPAGTMIEEISLRLPEPPVIASTVITDVIDVPEFVMNALLPLTTHSSPSSRAVVRMPPRMSEPPPGSVSPNAASRSPWQSGGSQPSRCSFDPYRKIGMAPRPTAASSVIATEESTRASSCKARQNAK